MKRFALNSLLVLICFVAAFPLVVVTANIPNFILAWRVTTQKIIAISNSHLQCAISPELWPEYGNFNSTGAAQWIWLSKLKFLVEWCGARPKYVLLDYGLLSPSGGLDRERSSENMARFLLLQALYPTCPYPLSCSKLIEYCTSFRPLNTSWGNSHISTGSLGVIQSMNLRVVSVNPDVDGYYESCRLYFRVYEDIIVYARQHGIEPVLVACPIYPTQTNHLMSIEREIRMDGAKRLIDKYHLKFFDFLDEPMSEECFFDLSHLNKRGSEQFTSNFRKAFEEWCAL